MVIKSRPIPSLVLHILLMLFSIVPIVVYYVGGSAIQEAGSALQQSSGSTTSTYATLALALALFFVMAVMNGFIGFVSVILGIVTLSRSGRFLKYKKVSGALSIPRGILSLLVFIFATILFIYFLAVAVVTLGALTNINGSASFEVPEIAVNIANALGNSHEGLLFATLAWNFIIVVLSIVLVVLTPGAKNDRNFEIGPDGRNYVRVARSEMPRRNETSSVAFEPRKHEPVKSKKVKPIKDKKPKKKDKPNDEESNSESNDSSETPTNESTNTVDLNRPNGIPTID